MASIEKVEETVVREMFVMRYDRAELEERKANPMLLVREIESALNGKTDRPTGRVLLVREKKHKAKNVQKKKTAEGHRESGA